MNTFLANLYLRAITVRDREEGQTMAEYGIILALIAVFCIVGRRASRRPRSRHALDKVTVRLGRLRERWWDLLTESSTTIRFGSMTKRTSKIGKGNTNREHQQQDQKRESGQAMVEFAIVLPVLLVLVFGIIQFGIVFNHYLTLTDAVRAGARQAAVSRTLPEPPAAAKRRVRSARVRSLQRCRMTLSPGRQR